MRIRALAIFAVLLSCVILFGCAPKTEDQEQSTPETTTLPKEEVVEDLLPKDGYYVQENMTETVCYMHLQDQSGNFFIMNMPLAVTLWDGLLYIDSNEEDAVYSYKNEKLTIEVEETKFTMKYVGAALPEKYQPILPSAGTYAVSSISSGGNMEIYGTETDEILELFEDGTGTFYYGDQQHQLLLQNGILTVDGEPMGFSYYPEGGDTPILLLLWSGEDADSIALRPVEK